MWYLQWDVHELPQRTCVDAELWQGDYKCLTYSFSLFGSSCKIIRSNFSMKRNQRIETGRVSGHVNFSRVGCIKSAVATLLNYLFSLSHAQICGIIKLNRFDARTVHVLWLSAASIGLLSDCLLHTLGMLNEVYIELFGKTKQYSS